MKNKGVCEFITTIKNEDKFLSEKFVKAGLGQTTGGYLGKNGEGPRKTQKQHFLDYYSGSLDRMPSYNMLRCPQLILFVAEVFGVPAVFLNKAYKDFEKSEKAKGTINKRDKNGNYFWGTEEFRHFKKTLRIGEVNKIIKNRDDIEEIKNDVSRLFF